MPDTEQMVKLLEDLKDIARADAVFRFFQARPGGYGEGDLFWGIPVPSQRKISRLWAGRLTPDELIALSKHPVHEVRLTALMTLVLIFQRGKSADDRKRIAGLYLANTEGINNWDLVDSSAHQILGAWLVGKDWTVLIELAKSGHLWKQRIAMISTYAFIRAGIYTPTLEVAVLLLDHPHDLIHKAVGWMLREMGNRDFKTECSFLDQYCRVMPRTMLRYAIEKFPEALRQDYLNGRAQDLP